MRRQRPRTDEYVLSFWLCTGGEQDHNECPLCLDRVCRASKCKCEVELLPVNEVRVVGVLLGRSDGGGGRAGGARVDDELLACWLHA